MADNDENANPPPEVEVEGEPDADAPEEEAEPEPVREDMVRNAVSFLTHPKVKGSSVQSRRDFLTKKGLTEAEIDEAFRRAPDDDVAAPQPARAPPPVRPPPKRPVAARSPAPAPAQKTGAAYPPPAYPPPAYPPQQQYQQPMAVVPQQAPAPPAQMRWTQMVLATGVLCGGFMVAKKAFAPYLRPALKAIFPEAFEGLVVAAEDKSEEQNKWLAATTQALENQTRELNNTMQTVKDLVQAMEPSKDSIATAIKESVSAATAESLEEMKGEYREELRRITRVVSELANPSVPSHLQVSAVGQTSGGASNVSSTQLYSELVEIKSILNNHPPTPQDKGVTPYKTSPGGGPSHVSLGVTFPATPSSTRENGRDPETPVDGVKGRISSGGGGDQPPHPASYSEVLEMLQQGKTPPGIQDIDDKPPNPDAEIPTARQTRRPKPWEQKQATNMQFNDGKDSFPVDSFPPGSSSSRSPQYGMGSFSGAGSSSGVSITEIDTEEGSSSQGGGAKWKPPPRPGVAVPEAKAAIQFPTPEAASEKAVDEGEGESADVTGETAQTSASSIETASEAGPSSS